MAHRRAQHRDRGLGPPRRRAAGCARARRHRLPRRRGPHRRASAPRCRRPRRRLVAADRAAVAGVERELFDLLPADQPVAAEERDERSIASGPSLIRCAASTSRASASSSSRAVGIAGDGGARARASKALRRLERAARSPASTSTRLSPGGGCARKRSNSGARPRRPPRAPAPGGVRRVSDSARASSSSRAGSAAHAVGRKVGDAKRIGAVGDDARRRCGRRARAPGRSRGHRPALRGAPDRALARKCAKRAPCSFTGRHGAASRRAAACYEQRHAHGDVAAEIVGGLGCARSPRRRCAA